MSQTGQEASTAFKQKMNGSRQLGLTLLYQEVFLEEASAAAVARLSIAAG